MNASIDVGRPLHLAINPDMGLEITRFFDDFTVHQSESPTSDPPHKSPKAASTVNVPAVTFFNVTTRDISLELSMTPRDDCPKVLLGMSGNRGSMRIKYDEQGEVQFGKNCNKGMNNKSFDFSINPLPKQKRELRYQLSHT